MRIDQLALEQYQPLSSTHPQRGTRAVDLTSSLNVLDCRSEGFSHALTDLVGHVLYGARHPVTGVAKAEGYVDISSPLGKYRLRRGEGKDNEQGDREFRLTVAPLEGQVAQPDTARRLLGPLSPTIAARLMAPRWDDVEHLKWLLGPEVAAELRRMERDPAPRDPNNAATLHQQLFAERDRLTHQLETMLGEKRRASIEFDTQLQALEQQRIDLAEGLKGTRQALDRVVAELAELETQRRYRELADLVERTADQVHHAERQEELQELDVEIDRWRQVLAELERREAQVRLTLSQQHPDEASPRLPIADQRAAVAVAERLVSDLDSEVARLARADGRTECVCLHAHARLHPLVDTLGEQIDTMARLIGQYEVALAAQQLRAEAQHLARSQAELRATLDHLLDRRQEGLRTSRSRKAGDARHETVPLPLAQPEARWETLQRQRGELEARIVGDQQQLMSIDERLEQIRDERTRLMTDPVLARLQSELDEVNRKLQGVNLAHPPAAVPTASPWRASDILTKLSDGRLREAHLTHAGRAAEVVDRHGVATAAEQLPENDRQLLTISLHLAAVAAVSRWGTPLPLVLAEPFVGLSSQATSILALVLHDFAQAGHQVVVFTINTMALDRWRAAGQGVIDWQRHSRLVEAASESARIVTPEVTRVAVARTIEAPEEPFTLLADDPMDRFPILGAEGQGAFGRLGIHTVGDLIEAEPEHVASGLNRQEVTPQVVELWQSHAALLAFVPHLDLQHAQLLTAVGVWRPEQLAAASAAELTNLIEAYLASAAGERLRKSLGKIDGQQVATWITNAAESRDRWEESRAWNAFRQRTLTVAKLHQQQADGESRSTKSKSRQGQSASKQGASKKKQPSRATLSAHTPESPRALRFRLQRSSPVADAPSIGPKMAKRLQKLGIKTVTHLLAADPAETSEGLGEARVAPERIAAWQHEAQLMCRVPELLARDVQVLVGCGFTSAEEVAKASPTELWEFAKSYCATPAGARHLRGAAPPDLARVTKWVRWAGHRRALDAA